MTFARPGLKATVCYAVGWDLGRAVPAWPGPLVSRAVSGLDFKAQSAHRAVPCWHDKSFIKPKHGPRTTIQILVIRFYMHLWTNVTIAIRKHINYGW